ncbi:hypothetical protein BH24ACT25_BH24ACT25_09280 [soil metagenome]
MAEGRRTVQITGQAVSARSRQRPRRSRELGSSPDRLALWAVVLCLFMALVAAATARGDDRPDAAERGAGPVAPAVESSR